MRLNGDVLVVMAKYPRVGEVKTRLAADLGAEAASRLYTAFLQDIAARFEEAGRTVVWAVDPPGSDIAPIAGPDAVCIDQEGDGLAQRMLHVFERLFGLGASRVVMIGGDVPHLPPDSVRAAFRALGGHDVTLVPSTDGGYCLVGLCRPIDIFIPVEMSTPEVFEQTCALIGARGLRLHVLSPSFDIDEPTDLRRLADLIRAGEVDLPHTAAVLETLNRVR